MKILVTGASGLLGAEFCTQLMASHKHEVWAVDNHSRSSIVPHCDQWICMDLTDQNDIRSLPTDFERIYHYAAINGTRNFYERPNHVLRTNTMIDLNVFDLARRCTGLDLLIYASSSEVVSGDAQSPVPENADICVENIHNPRWSYRLPKVLSENYLANCSDFNWLILRYFNVYGSQSKDGHFVADQMRKIRQGRFEIIGATETRSFCHVSDAVEASLVVSDRTSHEVVNIGNDREISVLEAANVMAQAMGHSDPQWIQTNSLSGSTPQRRPDISRLHKIFPAYQPRTFEQGIQHIVDSQKELS